MLRNIEILEIESPFQKDGVSLSKYNGLLLQQRTLGYSTINSDESDLTRYDFENTQLELELLTFQHPKLHLDLELRLTRKTDSHS